jgi:hypothetical protein
MSASLFAANLSVEGILKSFTEKIQVNNFSWLEGSVNVPSHLQTLYVRHIPQIN